MTIKRLYVTTLVALTAACAVACSPAEEGPEAQPSRPITTIVADSDWAYDVEDDYMVAGAADTVIVGTVLSQSEPSQTRQAPNPETQFEVQVVSTLKGDVEGTVTVSQLGGYSPEADAVVLSGDDPLLIVGETYVMALVFDPAVGWYTASPATNGIEPIPTDQVGAISPDGTQRRGAAPEPAAVVDMRDAIANEQVPQPGE